MAGHGFAVVAMQAGIALLVLDERPDQVRTSLKAIKSTSEQSLAQLRGMLDAVHPQASNGNGNLAMIADLVDEMRTAGMAIELQAQPVDLAQDAGVVAYRVVQEALTNVLRHAGDGASALVRIAHLDGEVLLHVYDDGHGVAGEPRPGRGLTGMRRRVEAAGGRFEAGPRAGGGFQVVVRLPRAQGA